MKGGEQDENRIGNNSGSNPLFRYLRDLYVRGICPRGPKITKEEVLGMLDNSDVIIIDLRSSGGELKIKGAVREDPKM